MSTTAPPPRTGGPALQAYLTRFTQAAAATRVSSDRIGEAIGEIETHVADSGEDPRETFGDPTGYAHRLDGNRHAETLWAAVVRLLALMYGAASLGAGLFTVASRLTGPHVPSGSLAGRTFPSSVLVVVADGYLAGVWVPTLVMPALAALLVAATWVSARHATPLATRRMWWLLFAGFLVVLLWCIPSMLATWQTLGYPAESPWKYQIPPGLIFAAAAAVATVRRHPRPQPIYDPGGYDRTHLARNPAPALLTVACGLLALFVFPLLQLTWF